MKLQTIQSIIFLANHMHLQSEIKMFWLLFLAFIRLVSQVQTEIFRVRHRFGCNRMVPVQNFGLSVLLYV